MPRERDWMQAGHTRHQPGPSRLQSPKVGDWVRSALQKAQDATERSDNYSPSGDQGLGAAGVAIHASRRPSR
jgi:hypothetical protein